jgi:hypothetical protein
MRRPAGYNTFHLVVAMACAVGEEDKAGLGREVSSLVTDLLMTREVLLHRTAELRPVLEERVFRTKQLR